MPGPPADRRKGGHMSNELILDSLRRRFRALFSLYEECMETTSLEQINHHLGENVMPIAFSLFHYVNMHDASFMMLSGEMFIANDEWMQRIAPSIPDHGKHRTPGEMHLQQIGDKDAFNEYMNLVFGRTEKWLATLDPAELDRVLLTRPFGPQVANTYSARVAGEAGLTVLDGVECWLYQHGLRHMGEIEHARAFVGLTGFTS
ncbi:MAG: hypothetical protein EBS48_00865 [Actinobacteria bacterium]|jgi:hypothetical protein|nr:hypothetical protein [Actinomycetota bacterium]NBU15561.1 hypothetical protein [Actinomycetota bacterium]